MKSANSPIAKSPNAAALAVFIAAVVVWAPATGAVQGASQFRARLSTVPIDVAMQSTIAGSGTATAVLTGTKLAVTGTFANLKSPATVARIHVAPKGMRGPAVFDVQVTAGTSGTITGAVNLTAAQIEDLRNSRFYIQLHSEKAPDGNLWGWLLAREVPR